MDELDSIAEKILDLWREHKPSGHPYLLSALGNDLGGDLARLKLLTGDSLTAFLRNHLTDQVQLVRLGEHGNIDALIATGANPQNVPASPPSFPRYHYRFWAAFSVPATRQRRLLDLSTFTFDDDDGSGDVREGKIAISSDYIAPAEAAQRDELIKQNIERWLKANGLEANRFYQRTSTVPSGTSGREQRGASVLEAMLAALDRHQLQSTQMSLDVVGTLLRARLG